MSVRNSTLASCTKCRLSRCMPCREVALTTLLVVVYSGLKRSLREHSTIEPRGSGMRGWQRKPPVKERRLLKCLQQGIKKEERYKKSSGYVFEMRHPTLEWEWNQVCSLSRIFSIWIWLLVKKTCFCFIKAQEEFYFPIRQIYLSQPIFLSNGTKRKNENLFSMKKG